MKVIYILSPARSGSTFLEYLLSSNDQIISLGEVGRVLRDYCDGGKKEASFPCSCGVPRERCPFWGELLHEFAFVSQEEGLALVLERFRKLYLGKMLLDSSKSGDFLCRYYLPLQMRGDIDLRVLFLVRDFRGWVTSVVKHRRRASHYGIWNNVLFSSYRWLYSTIKWLFTLNRMKIPYLCVSYEYLIFHTKSHLSRICKFIGLETPYLYLNPKEVHELYGSPGTRSDCARRTQIIYDPTWFLDVRFNLLGPLLTPVCLFNAYYMRKVAS